MGGLVVAVEVLQAGLNATFVSVISDHVFFFGEGRADIIET